MVVIGRIVCYAVDGLEMGLLLGTENTNNIMQATTSYFIWGRYGFFFVVRCKSLKYGLKIVYLIQETNAYLSIINIFHQWQNLDFYSFLRQKKYVRMWEIII